MITDIATIVAHRRPARLDHTVRRYPTHVDDVPAVCRALEAAEPGRHEIYNLGNGNGYSNREVLATVDKVTGKPLTIELAPRREGDAVAVVASSEKAARRLGWKPAHPELEQIISDAWRFHQQHQPTAT